MVRKIDVEVIAVIRRARAEKGLEALAGGRRRLAEEALLVGSTAPAGLHRHHAAVVELEAGDVEGVAEGMLGEPGAPHIVAAPAGIVGDLPDLDHRRAEPRDRRRLHRLRSHASTASVIGQPSIALGPTAIEPPSRAETLSG